MGGKGGGSSGGSNLSTGTQQQSDQTHTDQTSVYQPAALGTFQNLVNAADMLTSQPFSPYGPDQFAQNYDAWPYLVAPRNTYEQQVLANAGNLYQYAAPYINAAGQMTNDAYNKAGNFGWGMLGNASNVMEGALPYVGAGGQMVQGGIPLVGQGSQLTQLGTREVPRLSGQDIEPYLSPYQQWVINATMDNIAENQSRQQEDVLGNAASRGALGGDRLAVAQAELARQQGLSANQTLSGLWNQNYQQALQTAQGQQGVQQSNLQRQLQGGQGMGQLGGTMGQLGGTMGQLGGVQGQIGQGMGNLAGVGNQVASTQGNLASQMGNLGLANQQAFSQQLNALGAAGSQERAFEQQRLNAIYEQYLREQGFPFQALQYRAGIQMPAAGGMGGQQLGIGNQLSNMYGTSQSMTPSGQGGGGGNPMGMIGSLMSAGKGLHSGGRVYADGGAINPFAGGGMVIPGQGMTKAQSIFPDIPITDPKIHWPEAVKFMPKPNKMSGSGGKGGGKGGGGSKSQMPKMPKMPTGKSEQQAGKELARAAVQKEAQEPGTTDPRENPNGQADTQPATQPMPNAAGQPAGGDSFGAGESVDQLQGNAAQDQVSPFDTYAMGSEDYFGGAQGGLDGDIGSDLGDLGGGGFDEAGFGDLGGDIGGGFGDDDLMGGGGDFGGGGKGFSGGGKGFGGRVGYDEGGDVDFADFEDDLGGEEDFAEAEEAEEDVDEVSAAGRNVQLPEIVVTPEQGALDQGRGGTELGDRVAPQQGNSGLSDFIKAREGYSPNAYWDHKQYSIGYGTRGNRGETITRDEADRRLESEVGKARQSVEQFAPHAPSGVKDALTSLTYNAGPKWQNAGLGQLVKQGNWDAARDRFMQYNRASGSVNPGLVNRRGMEVSQLWNGRGSGTAMAGNSPAAAMQRTVAQSQRPISGEGLANDLLPSPVSAFAPEPESRGVEGSRLPNDMRDMGQMNFPGAPGQPERPFPSPSPRNRSALAGLSLPAPVSAFTPEPGRQPRSSASRLTLPPAGGELSDSDMETLQPGPMPIPDQGPAAPAPFAPPGRSTPSGGRANMPIGRSSPQRGPQTGMMRAFGPEGGEMMPVYGGGKGMNSGPESSPFAQQPEPRQERPPMGPPLQSLAPMFRGMANSRSPYPGISLAEGLMSQIGSMNPQQAGQRFAQQALQPDKSGNRRVMGDDGHVYTIPPKKGEIVGTRPDGTPIIREAGKKAQQSPDEKFETWKRQRDYLEQQRTDRDKRKAQEKGGQEEAAFKLMQADRTLSFPEAMKRVQGHAEGGMVEEEVIESPEQILAQPADQVLSQPGQALSVEVPEEPEQDYSGLMADMDEISDQSKSGITPKDVRDVAKTYGLNIEEAEKKARELKDPAGSGATPETRKAAGRQVLRQADVMEKLIKDREDFDDIAGVYNNWASELSPNNPMRLAYEKLSPLTSDQKTYLDLLRNARKSIDLTVARNEYKGQGQVSNLEREGAKILGEIGSARSKEDALRLMQNFRQITKAMFDLEEAEGAQAAPVERPKSVPQGSLYSPSKKMWKDPSGRIYNADGKPVQ